MWLTPLVLAACATARPTTARASQTVRYRVEIPDPTSQYLEVEAHLPGGSKHTDLALPAWTPGSYLIRDFGKHVYDLAAQTESGAALPVTPTDKHTWRVRNRGRAFVVRYRVFAATRSVRTSHVDDTHASLNGASVFVFEPGKTARPREVEVVPPPGWSVHSALDGPAHALVAASYDALVDAPIEMGTPWVHTFDADGTRFEYVLTGADTAPVDTARLTHDAESIVSTMGEMMGGFPMKRYVFFMQLTDEGGGGLEHASSTMMMMRRTAFDTDDAYERATRLTAHEFFHLWNVKRIHDQQLGPFDYLQENYSRLLWFHEGFTETMESLAMRRSEQWSAQQYLDKLAQHYTAYRRKPGRNAMPLGEISMRAWTHAYQPEINHPNVTISYYDKGDLLGVALDLEIRLRSDGRGSLLGVFRRLMRDFGSAGRGITQQDIIEAASAEAGSDVTTFFERYVEGTEELPVPELLERAGITVQARPPWRRRDGKPARNASRLRAWLGVKLRDHEVRNVVPDGPAAQAGLMRGDEIVAVQGRRTDDETDVRRELGRVGPGHTAVLSVFRGQRLLELSAMVAENPERTYAFALPEQPSSVVRRWLQLPAPPAN